jgi:hypothetical protein
VVRATDRDSLAFAMALADAIAWLRRSAA